MRKWLPLIKELAGPLLGLTFIGLMTWFGISELYRVLTTGELLARFGRGGGERGYVMLISFETSPANFVIAVGVHLVMVAAGMYCWVRFWNKARSWWNAK